ncbi:GGDEF domain-containing protein [Cellvibrio fibrivorans]|uniref:diguanylate cyclase n=1 Tax=Cellvibrio fibrivorans TaxID=126350 RepID=A0ABU1V2B7_9GAMM|nr:GGDEF domain-containing protein [Cellvibrio fibrivorans]MDR7091602.1 diguanylate cyclase (GGDEF)-like protein [Cellvibrio fibrivorans]
MLTDSKNKFQRGMVYLFAILASLVIAPFCVIRYLNGEIANAAVDLAIVMAALGSAIYTYRLGQATQLVSNITALLYSSGAVAVAHLNEPIYVFWLFPSLIANFFLLNATAALIANGLTIAAVLPIAIKLNTTTEAFAMVASLLMCGSMAYVFALLTHKQQLLLQGYANQDALTQLGNRRAMDEEMRLSIADCARNQTPATLIILDLDFFKMVNDKFGHTTGDDVLVDLAHLLTRRVRKTDRVFRFGGEEFVVLARNTHLADALVIAEQLRVQIEMELNDPDGALTASFGCAQLHIDETPEDWFIRADKAVYQAKQQGRNCVVAAE